MSSPLDNFGLNFEQTRILHSFQYFLVLEDINRETYLEKKQLKRKWLNTWKASIEKFLETLAVNSFSIKNISLYDDYSMLQKATKEMRASLDKNRPLCSIIFELSLFSCYKNLNVKEYEEFKDLKISESFKTKIVEKIEDFATEIGIEKEYVKKFKSNYQKWSNEITGSNPLNLLLGGLIGGAVIAAVAAAIAIPVIVPLLAPIVAPGLSGAAAISSVLAFLGGGAIAAGGFGMAGGMAVIVGGGAILGTGAGTSIRSFLAQSPGLVVHEAAKFLVYFNDIILVQKDVTKYEIASSTKEIVKILRDTIHSLNEQIFDMQIVKSRNQEEIKNLEKGVQYLRKALEISQNSLAEFLRNNGLS